MPTNRRPFIVVRNPDISLLVFCFVSIFCIIAIFSYFLGTGLNYINSFISTGNQITKIAAFATFVVLSIEGFDIMKTRYQEYLDNREIAQRKLKEKMEKEFADLILQTLQQENRPLTIEEIREIITSKLTNHKSKSKRN